MSNEGLHRCATSNMALLHLRIPREQAADLGHKTVRILEAGHYLAASGNRVEIEEQVQEAVNGTVSYPPEIQLQIQSSRVGTLMVEVQNDTTLEAVRYLRSKGHDPVALNFASATSPGGGFLSGALAQEEYLCRSSGLYACLRDNSMYTYHAKLRNAFYTDYVLYSPNVPIIRDDAGNLLSEPYPCSIITSPAVHAKGVSRYMTDRVGEVPGRMWQRVLKVLAVAEKHGHRSLILGAWGCGAFGNDSTQIAGLFRKALEEHFAGAFDQVVFAITDWSDDEQFIGPFASMFREGRIGEPSSEAVSGDVGRSSASLLKQP